MMVISSEEIDVLKKLERQEREFYLQPASLSVLKRLKEGGVLKRIVPVPFLPKFLGGDWQICGAVGRIEEGKKERIITQIPYIYEMIHNWTIPSTLGHNFAFFFYTQNLTEKVIKGIEGFEFFELYQLAQYSFPLKLSLSREEEIILKELLETPDLITTLSSLLREKPKAIKLENILRGEDNEFGFLSFLPEINWAILDNFLHCHFLLLTSSGLVQMEVDLNNFREMVESYERLNKKGEIKGIIVYKENEVINNWAKGLLSFL
ncbi:MAG: hypothetical protein ABIK81_00220 [candidate division WOR-3 bacterium]